MDEIEAGRDIGVGFSVVTMILWGSTYIFRVATKDMTYVSFAMCCVIVLCSGSFVDTFWLSL